MTEMMEMLMYLAENGYDFEDLTFEDFEKYANVDLVREIMVNFFGEDPRA